MTNDRISYKLPLLEAVIAIVVFAVLCVPIVTIYVRADRLGRDSARLGSGMLVCENTAELLHSGVCRDDGSSFVFTGKDGSVLSVPHEGRTEFDADDMRVSLVSHSETGADCVLLTVDIEVYGPGDDTAVAAVTTAVCLTEEVLR